MMYDVNSDNRFADLLLDLKRHIRHCQSCAGAIRVNDHAMLCTRSRVLILTMVMQYDHVIPRRLQAKRESDRVVYACPDLTRHGKAYAMTADPLFVVGVQESLF